MAKLENCSVSDHVGGKYLRSFNYCFTLKALCFLMICVTTWIPNKQCDHYVRLQAVYDVFTLRR